MRRRPQGGSGKWMGRVEVGVLDGVVSKAKGYLEFALKESVVGGGHLGLHEGPERAGQKESQI